MKKKIKKFGNSLCITIDANEKDIYKIREGDIIDINIKRVIKSKLVKYKDKKKKIPPTKLKAIILAGGLGSRMKHLVFHKPKCFLEIGGKTLLQRAVDNFRECGIKDIVIIAANRSGEAQIPGIKYYFKSDFGDEYGKKGYKGMLPSLFYAESEMKNGFIFSYSDILFKKEIVEKLLQDKNDIAIVNDIDWMEGYRGRTDHPISEAENVVLENEKVVRIGKNLTAEESHGEFIGVAKFSAEGAKKLLKTFRDVEKKFEGKPFHEAKIFENSYLTDILQEMIDRNYNAYPVNIRGGWHEIDTIQDLERVTSHKRW